MGSRKQINFFKLHEAYTEFSKNDIVLVSGSANKCTEGKRILKKLGLEPLEIVIDIKSNGTKNFLKDYINTFSKVTLIAEHEMENKLVKKIYKGRLKIITI